MFYSTTPTFWAATRPRVGLTFFVCVQCFFPRTALRQLAHSQYLQALEA